MSSPASAAAAASARAPPSAAPSPSPSPSPLCRLLTGSAAAAAGLGLAAAAVAFYRYRQRQQKKEEQPYEYLLFDIEGTTTPISFVKEILFPYVTSTIDTYLASTVGSDQTQSDIAALMELSESDAAAGVDGLVRIERLADGSIDLSTVAANVRWQVSIDRKSTALKQLQGRMWSGGYESGQLKAQLFGGANGDVARMMRAWHVSGLKLAIYSSGSVAAQQLLFKYSDAGDLTPILQAYFDTKVGMKQEANSYAKIAQQLNVSPSRILFLTDIYGEAAAARQSGVDSVILVRPGNYQLPPEQTTGHAFPIAHDFDEVEQFIRQQARNRTIAAPQEISTPQTQTAQAVDTSSGQFNTF